MKNFVKVIVNVLIIVMMLATLAGGAYWYSWQQNVPVAAAKTTFSNDQAKVGEALTAEILVQTPWYRKVLPELSFSGTTDDVKFLEDQIEISEDSYNLHGRVWLIKAQLLAFNAGSYKDLQINIPLSTDRAQKQNSLKVTLPELQIKANEIKGDITFMGAIAKEELLEAEILIDKKHPVWYYAVIAAAVIAIISLLIFLNKKIRTRPLTYWQQARNNLDELEKAMPLEAEKFYVILSDTIRQYIEKRFSLAATEQTSEEFIQTMRYSSLIDDKQKSSLTNFLNAADLVKFARASTEDQELVRSLTMARHFIEDTLPQKGDK